MKNLLKTEMPIRLVNAVTKLYNAFHENRLEPYDCTACAVGNICDNKDEWAYGVGNSYKELQEKFSVNYPKDSMYLEKIGLKSMDNKFSNSVENNIVIKKTGYSASELSNIESIFLKGFEYSRGDVKENQFNGLCAVVEYLCQLDNVPNVMDIQSLFEFENDAPKRQLSEILV